MSIRIPHAAWRLVLPCAVAVSAAGADAPSPSPAIESTQILAVFDHDAAVPASGAVKPMSLWSDPAAAAAAAHVAKQIELLSGGLIPAGADLAGGWHSARLAILPAKPDDPDPLRARFELLLHHALATQLRDAFGPAILRPSPAKIGPFDGFGNPGFYVGAAGDLLAVGDPTLVAGPSPSVPPEAKGAALWLRCDLGPTLALVKSLEPDGISYGLDPLLPRWRDEAATLTISAAPAGEAWASTITLTASQLPFHAIAPAVSALGRSGKHARIAVGLEPRAVVGLVSNLLDERGERELTQKLGMPLSEIAACFTGDAIALVDASGLIPQGCIALQLARGHDAKPLAAAVAAIWKGQEVEGPNAVSAWMLDTPLGPWGLALAKDLLVIGNDPELAQQLLAGTPGDAPIPAGKAVVVDIDLPLLAKQWLPLAWRLIGDARIDLGDDPLVSLQFRIPDAATALIQSVGAAAKLSALVKDPPPTLSLQRGGAHIAWTEPPQLMAQMRSLLGEHDLGAALDQAFACYVDAAAKPAEVLATVMREADGFHVLEDDRRNKRAALNAAQLAQRLGALKRALGPDPAQLRAIAPPERPSIDRRWLPDPATIQRHLPPYHLEVEMTADGAQAHERGAPLGATAAAGAIIYLGLFQQPRMHQYHQHFSGQQPPATPPKPGTVEF